MDLSKPCRGFIRVPFRVQTCPSSSTDRDQGTEVLLPPLTHFIAYAIHRTRLPEVVTCTAIFPPRKIKGEISRRSRIQLPSHCREKPLHAQRGQPNVAGEVFVRRLAPPCRSHGAGGLFSMHQEGLWSRLWPKPTPICFHPHCGRLSRCSSTRHSCRISGAFQGCDLPDPILSITHIHPTDPISIQSVVPRDV